MNDGTSNQTRPIRLMIEALDINSFRRSKRAQSLDLTAATDRLPVDVQAQILNLLGYPGTLWKDVLDREWHSDAGPIKYAVGQPMGAYSSFAMLALTNHVLVHIAMNETEKPFTPYGVLGDDVAIADKKVSDLYRFLLQSLGVEVNPIKGFDGGIIEFAKQLWTINGYNLSPLGAKNITLCLRNPAFLGSILYELWNKMFPVVYLLSKSEQPKRRFKLIKIAARQSTLITSKSILHLYSKLWSNSRFNLDGTLIENDNREMKYSWVGSYLHLLSYIGPRSGLWNINDDVRGKYTDWAPDLYRKIWFKLVCKLFDKKELTKSTFKSDLFSKIKFNRENEIDIFRFLRVSWSQGINLSREVIYYPFNSLPRVRGLYVFSNKIFQLKNELITLIYLYSLLFSPSVLIVIWSYYKNFMKLIPKAIRVIEVRILRILFNQSRNGFVRESFIGTGCLLILTYDVWLTVIVTVIMFLWNLFITWERMRIVITRRIYWSKAYGQREHNIVTDMYSSIYNPLEPISDLLNLVEREVKTSENVPAFKEMRSLLRFQKLVKSWLLERNKVKLLEIQNRKEKQLKIEKDKINFDQNISSIRIKQDNNPTKSGITPLERNKLRVRPRRINKKNLLINTIRYRYLLK